jgi:formate/nitrite transporter FocA (FNT family)
MSPAFWGSLALTIGILIGGLFVIGLMYAVMCGEDKARKEVRGGGMVE